MVTEIAGNVPFSITSADTPQVNTATFSVPLPHTKCESKKGFVVGSAQILVVIDNVLQPTAYTTQIKLTDKKAIITFVFTQPEQTRLTQAAFQTVGKFHFSFLYNEEV